MVTSSKAILKTVLYTSGILDGYYRRRNGTALTVVAFHRVLPPSDPRWEQADPGGTISSRLFEQCVDFLATNYSVIGLDELLRARRGLCVLPKRPLLITFDDGWADNEEYALPILQKAGLPAAFFVVADAVGKIELWQEAILRLWRHGRISRIQLEKLWVAPGEYQSQEQPDASSLVAMHELTIRLSFLSHAQRVGLFDAVLGPAWCCGPRQMLTQEQLHTLKSAGMAIGSHGSSHIPVPQGPDPRSELFNSRSMLAGMLRDGTPPVALSFPHGRYDAASIELARKAGYELLFTSDPCLNTLWKERPPSDILGRIFIQTDSVSDDDENFRPERLFLWLNARQQIILYRDGCGGK